MTEPMLAGWYRDPFGRYEKRYHTGTGWTEHVKNKGKAAIDPPHPRISDVAAPRRAPKPASAPIPAPPAARAPASTPVRPSPPVPTQAPVHMQAPAHAPAPPPARGPARARAGVPAASRSAVAVAFPPTANRRAASSYLKPAPKMAAEPEPRRVRWPWVVGAIVVLVGLAAATGIGVISGAPEEPRTAPASPQRAPHTITDVAYNFVTVGTPRARVLTGLGKRPADRAEYRRVFPIATTDNACAYYYGRAPRISYSFCFNEKDTLISKTTRSLPVSVREPSTKASTAS